MRKLLLGLTLLLLLAGGALGLAAANLSSYLERNRDWIAARLGARVGRKVTFEEIGLSILGGLGARVKGLRVADDPAYSKGDFVRATEARLKVRILPALLGRFEVARITLREPLVRIIRGPGGFNFGSIVGLAGRTGATGRRQPAVKEPAIREKAAPAFLLSVVDVEGAAIHYVDRTTSPPTELVAKGVDVAASNVGSSVPIRVKGAAAILGSGRRNFQLRGKVGPVRGASRVQDVPFDLSLDLGPAAVAELDRLPLLAAAIPPGLRVSGSLRLAVRVVGTADDFRLQGRCDGRHVSLGYGSVFRKPAGVPLWIEIEATRSGGSVDLAKLDVGLSGLDIAGKGKLGLGPPLTVDLEAESNRVPLEGWDELLRPLAGHEVSGEVQLAVRLKGRIGGGALPAIEGTLGLENLSARLKRPPAEIGGFSTRILLDGDSLVVPPSRLQLGGFPVDVSARVSGLSAPTIVWNLAAPELGAASLGLAGGGARRREVLRDLRVESRVEGRGAGRRAQARVRSAAGTIRDIDYRDLEADLTLHGGVLSLAGVSFAALGGKWRGDGRYDLSGPAAPKFLFRASVDTVSVAALLASRSSSLAGHLGGRLSADLQAVGSGREWRAIEKTLRGSGRAEVSEGVLKDVNIADGVLSGMTGIPGLSKLISAKVRRRHPELFGGAETRFERMAATIRIAEGRVRTDDLVLVARDYSMHGKGSFAFDRRVDLRARLVASRELTADLAASVKEIRYLMNREGRFSVPFRLAGTLPGLRPRVDRGFVLEALARAAALRGVEKLLGGKPKAPSGKKAKRKQPPRSPRELIRKGLEGLFGR